MLGPSASKTDERIEREERESQGEKDQCFPSHFNNQTKYIIFTLLLPNQPPLEHWLCMTPSREMGKG